MIPVLKLNDSTDLARAEFLWDQLRLDPKELALPHGRYAAETAAVQAIVADVAARGDLALVEIARKFDYAEFDQSQLAVTQNEMAAAAARLPVDQMSALRRSIAQVREYQKHILPTDPKTLHRPGVELGLRFTPLDSAGLYFPGGKAAYPSSLIMLAVPAQEAGVRKIVVCTPPSKYGRSDLVLAACHELK